MTGSITASKGCAITSYCVLLVFCLSWKVQSCAESFPLPKSDDAIVGSLYEIVTGEGDTLIDIAYGNNLGVKEIMIANPDINPWVPAEGLTVTLPKQYILPDSPREGIVVNVAEMRLYYFPAPNKQAERDESTESRVETFPVSIGREGWSTPIISAHIAKKMVDPVWYPPESIRKEHEANGESLPEKILPGQDNPLGKYALYLNVPFYLIHGTNKKFSIGMQITHGCIRLYPEDIKSLYKQVSIGTPVRIINQPFKVGWSRNDLYVEIHPWPEGMPDTRRNNLTSLVRRIVDATSGHPNYAVDWNRIRSLMEQPTGMPVPVGLIASTEKNITH